MKLSHLLGAFTRNWPLKLLSLALALLVFFAVRFSNTPLRRDQVVYAYPAAAAQGYPADRAAAAVIAAPAQQMPPEASGANETAAVKEKGSVKEKVTSAVDAIKKAVVPPIKQPPAVVIVAPPPPPMATNAVAAPSVPPETNAVPVVPVVPQGADAFPKPSKEAAFGAKGQ